jgi:hypothetical protein
MKGERQEKRKEKEIYYKQINKRKIKKEKRKR